MSYYVNTIDSRKKKTKNYWNHNESRIIVRFPIRALGYFVHLDRARVENIAKPANQIYRIQ